MSGSHWSRLLASGLVPLGAVALAAGMSLARAGNSGDSLDTFLFGFTLMEPYVVTGALIVAHLLWHRVGWVLWSFGFCSIANVLAAAWADYDDGARPLARSTRAIAWVGTPQVVTDLCFKVEHARHMGRMRWHVLNTGVVTARRGLPR